MPEDFDSEIEMAQYFVQDPQERIDYLTKLAPIKPGSRCTNDPLQIALARYAAQIAKTGKVFHNLGRKCDVQPD